MNQIAKIPLTLTSEIGRLSKQLEVADNDTIERCVLSLIAFGMTLPSTITPADIRKVYGFGLAVFAQGAIRTATEKLMRGAYGPEYTDFIPNPPRLASFVAIEQTRIVNDLAREKAKAEAYATDERIPKTDDEKARIREKVAAFKLQHAEFKREHEHGKTVDEEMTPDREAFLRQVLALPDRGALTEEERQYRRKTETLLEASK